MVGVPIRRGSTGRTHGADGHVTMEAETEVMQLQTNVCQLSLADRRETKEDPLL